MWRLKLWLGRARGCGELVPELFFRVTDPRLFSGTHRRQNYALMCHKLFATY